MKGYNNSEKALGKKKKKKAASHFAPELTVELARPRPSWILIFLVRIFCSPGICSTEQTLVSLNFLCANQWTGGGVVSDCGFSEPVQRKWTKPLSVRVSHSSTYWVIKVRGRGKFETFCRWQRCSGPILYSFFFFLSRNLLITRFNIMYLKKKIIFLFFCKVLWDIFL